GAAGRGRLAAADAAAGAAAVDAGLVAVLDAVHASWRHAVVEAGESELRAVAEAADQTRQALGVAVAVARAAGAAASGRAEVRAVVGAGAPADAEAAGRGTAAVDVRLVGILDPVGALGREAHVGRRREAELRSLAGRADQTGLAVGVGVAIAA